MHSDNYRTFQVSWTAGVRNGGSGGCILQYDQNGTWTDLVGGPGNCDVDVDTAVSLPSTGWIGADWDAVSVRLIRTSDLLVLETFSETLDCSTMSGSASSTPDIDEDCDDMTFFARFVSWKVET